MSKIATDHTHGEAHLASGFLIPLVLFERVLRDLDIFHHAFCTLRKRGTRLDLELGEHVALGVVRDGSLRDESSRQVTVVVFLKRILLRQESEERNRLVEDFVDFGFGFLIVGKRGV